MSQKHFIALAKSLARVRPSNMDSNEFEQWARDVIAVANMCSDMNAKFKRDVFINACNSW